jgi:plastocyanin
LIFVFSSSVVAVFEAFFERTPPMRMLPKISVFALCLTVVAAVACGDDDDDTAGTPPPGSGAGAAGQSAAGAAGQSAAGNGGTSAGAAGEAAAGAAGEAAAGAAGEAAAGAAGHDHLGGAAGETAGGAAGETAGGAAGETAGGAAGETAGGAAGSTASDPKADLAGCTFATATDGTSGPQTIVVAQGGNLTYTPKCLIVKVGTEVTFNGNSGVHPLGAFSKKGTLPNPITPGTETTIKVTFPNEGVFGYYCTNHGSDGGTAGMVGAIYVTPLVGAGVISRNGAIWRFGCSE